ncbi:TPR-like protein [Ramicandelaber brevisporus]|nr:TPR-like protein [Ramicandelaber brevisporus]
MSSVAHDLLKQAEAAANPTGWFSRPNPEKAGDLYSQAANAFKTQRQLVEAGDAYVQAAEMRLKTDDRDEAANLYVLASKSYKQVPSKKQDSVRILKQAVDILTERGRFHSAAGHMKDIAQTCETELTDLNGALQAYQTAGDWYAAEDSQALANNCYLKVATLSAQLGQYNTAIGIFERVGKASIENTLTRFSVKEYFLKAALCYMANDDSVGARQALMRYCEWDISFRDTRECKFSMQLVDDVDGADIESFSNHAMEYDRLTRLDSWKTEVLLVIKNHISAEPSLT